jgi:hypothetical protein
MSASRTNSRETSQHPSSSQQAGPSHRHRRPIQGEQQLALASDPDQRSQSDDDWVIDAGTRRVGLDAIHHARHLLDEAAQHDAVAAAKRSAELLRRVAR